MKKAYTIHRAKSAPSLDPTPGVPSVGWDKAEIAKVDWFHPASGDVRPTTLFRALYDEHNIYVRFDVLDTFVKVVHTRLHSAVCLDSAVELFLRPSGGDSYFNFEVNAGGTLLLFHIIDWIRDEKDGHIARFEKVDAKWCEQIEIHHSMPQTVRKPITEPIAWTVTYRIPLSLFTAYRGAGGVNKGDVWEGNIYKCGGSDHWACWSKIGEKLNFHQPKYFGRFIFG